MMNSARPVIPQKSAGKLFARNPLLLFCLALAGYLSVLITRAAVNVPFQDEFSFTEIYSALARGEPPAVSEIVAAHNGHPYLALKLLILVTLTSDIPWSWMMYAQVFLLAACALVVYRYAIAIPGNHIGSVLIASLVLLSPRLWENLYWAMQISAALALMAGLGSFYFATRFQEERRPILLAGSLGLGLLASVSSAAGFVAFTITVFVLISLRPRRDQFWSVAAVGSVGLVFFIAAQVFAVRGGVGRSPLALMPLVEHLVLMLSNTVAFFGQDERFIALAVGCAVASLVAYCFWLGIRAGRSATFELSCLMWGMVLVAVVTYSRLSMGIFQPDAPRYVPLVAPLIVGSVLILQRNGKRCLLYIVATAVMVGWLQSAVSEWKITPYRKANMTGALQQLCGEGRVEGRTLTTAQIKDIQVFFCGAN